MIKIWKSKEEKCGCYQIVEVTHMLEKLRYKGQFLCDDGDKCKFTSSNGYRVFSHIQPDIHNGGIYLMGSNRRKDNNIVKFPLHRFDGIVLAFKEFEEHCNYV